MTTIWVVDDEENIRNLIRRYLEKEGFKIRTFKSSEAAENALISDIPDMFILDIMLPGSDGLSLCRKIRETYELPIIFVSARGEEFDRVLGLELGADDYLAKPFSPRELVIRVKAIFRRLQPAESVTRPLTLKNMVIYPEKRKILINGIEVPFSTKEYDLIYFLASSPGQPFSREKLLEKIWSYDYDGEERAVDDTVKRIRKKIRGKEALPEISTVWGYGYRLDV